MAGVVKVVGGVNSNTTGADFLFVQHITGLFCETTMPVPYKIVIYMHCDKCQPKMTVRTTKCKVKRFVGHAKPHSYG